MKIAIQYVNDQTGKTKAVQLPVEEWEKLLGKLKKYEQTLKVKSDLEEAFAQVEKIRKGKIKKQTLGEFLNGL